MSGILFFGTRDLNEISSFYLSIPGCSLWLDQGGCRILQHGNLLIGFCEHTSPEAAGIITFFFNGRADIDQVYSQLESCAEEPPRFNERFLIYHFFARDPEGRRIEFQVFEPPVTRYLTGSELLLTRRSVRQFRDERPTDAILEELLELCRYSPTSNNVQDHAITFLDDREVLASLGMIRGENSSPLARAPMAAAISADPDLWGAAVQDGCIAAYHFMLAAWNLGLGTCWIAGLDRDDVKILIGVPQRVIIATITPLGYPQDPHPTTLPIRKKRDWLTRF